MKLQHHLHISDGAEAIVFQFENVIGIVERLCDTLEPHRLYAWEHMEFYHYCLSVQVSSAS
jgi:hypothetical protein